MQKNAWLLGIALAACGGGQSTQNDTTAHEASSRAEVATMSPAQACLQMMTRERDCQGDFIPALVSLRARLDLPPGFAAQDAADHATLVAQAEQEYAAGATDEAFQHNCAQMADIPAERASEWNRLMQACLPEASCSAFVACDMRFTEVRFSER